MVPCEQPAVCLNSLMPFVFRLLYLVNTASDLEKEIQEVAMGQKVGAIALIQAAGRITPVLILYLYHTIRRDSTSRHPL